MEAEAETNELLRTAVVRAGKIRTALAELKAHAFATASPSINVGSSLLPAGSPGQKPLAASPAPGTTSGGSSGQAASAPVLLLPQGGVPGIPALTTQFLAGLRLNDVDSSEVAALVGAADASSPLPSGERHAFPKTSRRDRWSMPANQAPRYDLQEAQWIQQEQQQQQQQQQHLFVAAAGCDLACGSGGGGSFDELLAALRAESRAEPARLPLSTESAGQAALLCGRSSPRAQLSEPHGVSYGSTGTCRRGQAATSTAAQSSSAAWDSSSGRGGNSVNSSGSSRAQRLAGTQRRQGACQAQQQQQQQQQQPMSVAPFDRNAAARQLKEKLDLVNTAKRQNEARLRGSASRTGTPRARAPAAPPSRSAPVVPRLALASLSRACSVSSSRQSSGRLGGQEVVQQHMQQWRPWQVLSSPESSPPQAARRQADGTASEGEEPPPMSHNCLPLAREERGSLSAATAAPPRSARKESHISLSELLSTPTASNRAADSGAGSVAGAAVPASAAAYVAQSLFVAAIPNLEPAELPAAAPPVEQCQAGAGIQPAAAAPPMHDTPRHENAADNTPRPVAGAPGSVIKQCSGSAAGHLANRLASPFGRLQSPPATPLEATAAAGTAGLETAASSASSSPEQASIASSGSPEQQPVSPRLRRFPILGDEGPDGQETQQQQEQRSASAGAFSKLVLEHRSHSSIGRKRANSEAGCSEGPSSVKKHSPEVGSRRQLTRTAELQGAPPAAAEGAAPLGQQQQQQHEPQDGRAGSVAGLFADAAQPKPLQQVERPSSRLATRPLPASKPSAHADQLLLPPAADSVSAGGSRLVMPVVLQHSPRPQRAQQQQQQQQQLRNVPQQQAAAATVAADMAEAERPPLQPAQAVGPPQPAAKPAHAAAQQATAAAKTAPQQQQAAAAAETAPQQQQAAAAAAAKIQRTQLHEPQPAPVRAQQASVAVPLPHPTSPEHELPAHSRWVPSMSSTWPQQAQQQHFGDDQPDMPSSSVLLSSSGQPEQQQTTPRPARTLQKQHSPPVHATPPAIPPLHTAAAAAVAATAAAAAALASARNITPRRRMASLEPAEAELCLQEHPQGKQLLAAAPELAGMPGGALLDTLCQGVVVRKAWVRSNFKLGGSTRRIQLAPGSGGRPEMLYPSGLFRKPLRFAVRRAVVNSPAWRPGNYLVLDTARGMLRLEPGSAAEHARWVLALNTAFLASGAPAAGGRGGELSSIGSSGEGNGWQEVAVGEMRWSAAILLG